MTGPRPTGAEVAPLSFAQERLWLIDATAPRSAAYNVPLLTRWHEQVSVSALQAALDAVIARHDVLRTTYELRDDRPVQVVREPEPVAVEVIEAGPNASAEIAERAGRPFDLAAGPVLRCTVWRDAPGGDLMLLVVHHIAIDGWSLPVLYGDLAAAYRSAAAGERPALPQSSLRYTDFAIWDRETFDEPRRQEQLTGRAKELLEIDEELVLPGARTAAAEGDRPGAQQTFAIPGPLWTSVQELARTLRVTPFVVLQAAFQAVLARRSGRTDFVTGAVTVNRPHPDVEPLVGFFVNTVPLRCHVDPEWTFRELCLAARAEAYRCLSHQWIPYDRLTAEVAAVRADGHRPLVNVCFALQNWPAPRDEPAPWAPPTVLPTGTAKFDLLLIVDETPAGVVGTVEYGIDRYPDEVCGGVIRDYLAALTAGTADPDVPLNRIADTARNPAERRAVELFREALGADGLRATSDFFALGGHSLLAVTMLARAKRVHGISVSPREFLAEPTVAGLARLIAAGSAAPEQPATIADTERCPATSAQQRFWFIDRISAFRTAYLMPSVIELRGPVDPIALRAAVDRVVAHHPALRSRFELDRGQRRVYYRTDGIPPRTLITDASTWDPGRIRDHVADLCWYGFDLGTEAPVRTEIITTHPDRTLLVLVAHHIVADGWSRQLIVEQIANAYRDGAPPATAVHPALLTRDGDGTHTADLLAWLAGAPVDVWLPHDRPRPTTQSTVAATASATLDEDRTARLRAVAGELECTPFMMIAALLAVTLARRSSQRDFVFAFPWAGRDAPGSAEAVGMLVNTVPLRVDLEDVTSWRELLARVKESSAVSYRNADASFDVLAAALHPDRQLSRPPVTPVFLSAQDGPDEAPDFGVAARYLPLDPLHVKYELELTAVDHPGHWEFAAAYATALFDEATIADLLAGVSAAAADLAANPEDNPLVPRGKNGRDAMPEENLLHRVRLAWAEVLDVEPVHSVPLDVNFLEAGGNSLMLVMLWEQLDGLTSRGVKLSDLFEHGTVRAQAALLATD